MAANKNINREHLIAEIHAKQGVLSQVAKSMDISLPTVYYYRDRYATVATAIEEARNTFDTQIVDEGEIKLREAVREGKAWAVRYVLDNKGKGRGYGVQRHEHGGVGGDEIVFKVVYDR